MDALLSKKHKATFHESSENWESQKCTFLGILVVLIFNLCPKISILSWMISTLQFWNFGFVLILVGHVVLSVNFYIEKKSEPKNRYDNKPKIIDLLRRSVLNTFHDIFGVRNSVTCNAVSLLLASLLIVVVTLFVLPSSSIHTSKTFDSQSSNLEIINDPQIPGEFCLCKEVLTEGNSRLTSYFDGHYICMRYLNKDDAETNLTSSKIEVNTKIQISRCYDPIFFEAPFYPFLPSLNGFPTASTCFTFDPLMQLDTRPLKTDVTANLIAPFMTFDQQCYNLTIAERFIPCSEENVRNMAIYSSCLVILVCCGVFVLIFSTQVADVLVKMETIIDDTLTNFETICTNVIVKKGKLIISGCLLVTSASIFGFTCAKLNEL